MSEGVDILLPTGFNDKYEACVSSKEDDGSYKIRAIPYLSNFRPRDLVKVVEKDNFMCAESVVRRGNLISFFVFGPSLTETSMTDFFRELSKLVDGYEEFNYSGSYLQTTKSELFFGGFVCTAATEEILKIIEDFRLFCPILVNELNRDEFTVFRHKTYASRLIAHLKPHLSKYTQNFQRFLVREKYDQ